MSDEERIFQVVPVVRGERRPPVGVGTYSRPRGVFLSIEQAHLLMRSDEAIEYVRVYMAHPERPRPTYMGIVRRGVRTIVRG